MTLVLDIETVPTEAALALPYPEAERTPPSNYSKPDSIAAWRDKDRAAWELDRIKGYSLSARLGRVLCVGLRPLAGDRTVVAMAPTEAEEALVLARVFAALREHGGRVVTWNGSWDLQFLVTRAMICGVAPGLVPETIRAWFRRYSYGPHYDAKAVLTQWAPPAKGEGLDQWARALDLTGKTDGVDGSAVYGLYQAGRLDAIEAYCAQDVDTTHAIYQRVAAVYGGVDAPRVALLAGAQAAGDQLEDGVAQEAAWLA